MDVRQTDEIDLTAFIRPLLRSWKFIALVMVVCAMATYGVSRLLPKTYRSSATVFVQNSSPGATILQSLPLPIMPVHGSSTAYLTAILKSDTLLVKTISKLKLRSVPGFTRGKRMTETQALKRLRKMSEVRSDRDGAITVSAKASDPYLAARIANAMVEGLGDLVTTSSRRKADFVAGKLDETAQQLKRAEDRLVAFSERNDVASIDEETKGLIDRLGEMDGKLLEFDTELQQVSSQLANAGDLNVLANLQVREKALQSSRDYLIEQRDRMQERLRELPEVAAEYMRLRRSIEVLTKTYELLTQQYQLARITQSGEDGDYQIIDPARPDEKPVAPRAIVNGVIGGALGFFVASLLAMAVWNSRSRGTRSVMESVKPKTPVERH